MNTDKTYVYVIYWKQERLVLSHRFDDRESAEADIRRSARDALIINKVGSMAFFQCYREIKNHENSRYFTEEEFEKECNNYEVREVEEADYLSGKYKIVPSRWRERWEAIKQMLTTSIIKRQT